MQNRYYLGLIAIVAVLLIAYVALVQPKSSNQNQTSQVPQQKQIESTKSAVSKECDNNPTPSLTEGPYYKTASPQRTNISETKTVGIELIVTGYVFDTDCQPIANAWLDFWQADGNGNYDNVGYKLRGHQLTDANGKYQLETVIPGRYPGRTPHIHVKVQANRNSPILTSQLFMPQEPQNQQDVIFNQALVMDVKETPEGKEATFNFIVK